LQLKDASVLTRYLELHMKSPTLAIDLPAMQANFASVKALVGPRVSVSAVLKSDAYGLGLERLAAALFEAGCGSFFVADIAEGVRLRRRLGAPEILVFSGVTSSQVDAYHTHSLIPVCNTMSEVIVACTAKTNYAMNLETGFNRLGLSLDEVRSFAHAKLPPPILLMSHLACADDRSSDRNILQKNRFCGMTMMIGGNIPRSLSASSGLFLGAAYHFDQVRVGSALYGLNNAAPQSNPFLPVIRLSASLIDVRQVAAGETVGYMGTFRARQSMRLGVIGIGYRHGLAWQIANRLLALIEGHEAPIVGRISMEYCAVDLSEVPEKIARVGAGVDFITAARPAEQMARAATTVPQEILIRAGGACLRRYEGSPPWEF
jgi:alanine racemase